MWQLTYKIFGMSFFDSLTHSMTTIATGGFSNYNESIGFFNSVSIEISAMIFIILGSSTFYCIYKIYEWRIKKFYLMTLKLNLFLRS